MARYTGPKQKKARAFGEAIYGPSKAFDRKKYRPGQHGTSRRRGQKSDYANQLMEKQKAKYTYGLLERQFRNLFDKASRKGGVTGEVLLQLLESRLDNTVYRLGLARTRRQARQFVSHRHVTVNGRIVNIPSYAMNVGDIVGIKGKSKEMESIQDNSERKSDIRKFSWLEFNSTKMEGVFLEAPTREQIPENINEQLIVELYSK